MLDIVGYQGKNILNKHILDSSCGTGNFLVEAVQRYLEISKDKPNSQIKKELENYIHGIEIDPLLYSECLKRLNALFIANYDIRLGDALTISDYNGKMDFVVGNPPYVKIQNLEKENKELFAIQGIKGMFNLYLLFYFLSFQQLNKNGKLIYLTPNFAQTIYAKKLREKISQEQKLIKLFDFQHYQIFKEITTYSVIALFNNSVKSSVFDYSLVGLENEKLLIASAIQTDWKKVLVDNRFVFSSQDLKAILESDYKKQVLVKTGFQTSADKIFIKDKFSFNSADLIKAVKPSTGKIKECIFPYRFDQEKNKFVLKEFSELDENVQKYLLGFKNQLERRSLEHDKTKWWQFGRSQAISGVNHKKIYFNYLLNKDFTNIRLGEVPAGMGIYGGIYILPEKISFETIQKIIKSEQFKSFVRAVAEWKNHGYYLIRAKSLEKFLNYSL